VEDAQTLVNEYGWLLWNTSSKEARHQGRLTNRVGECAERLSIRVGRTARWSAVLKAIDKSLDIILFFVLSERALAKDFAKLANRLTANGMIWIAWPKKSSGVTTDLSFERVQRIGLDAGLVDVKICAVDETWSGLKFVYRLKDRSSRK
jgi:hypothetical protein